MITRHDKIDFMTKVCCTIVGVMTVLAVVYLVGMLLG